MSGCGNNFFFYDVFCLFVFVPWCEQNVLLLNVTVFELWTQARESNWTLYLFFYERAFLDFLFWRDKLHHKVWKPCQVNSASTNCWWITSATSVLSEAKFPSRRRTSRSKLVSFIRPAGGGISLWLSDSNPTLMSHSPRHFLNAASRRQGLKERSSINQLTKERLRALCQVEEGTTQYISGGGKWQLTIIITKVRKITNDCNWPAVCTLDTRGQLNQDYIWNKVFNYWHTWDFVISKYYKS